MEQRGIVLGRAITLSLHRHGMDDDGAAELLGVTEDALHGLDVMTVHRTDVGDTKALEEGCPWQHDLLERLLGCIASPHEQTSERAARVEGVLDLIAQVGVLARHAHLGEIGGKAADVGRYGHAVVVEHDEKRRVGAAYVIERLERHATGKRCVTDEGCDSRVGTVEVAGERVAERG